MKKHKPESSSSVSSQHTMPSSWDILFLFVRVSGPNNNEDARLTRVRLERWREGSRFERVAFSTVVVVLQSYDSPHKHAEFIAALANEPNQHWLKIN